MHNTLQRYTFFLIMRQKKSKKWKKFPDTFINNKPYPSSKIIKIINF